MPQKVIRGKKFDARPDRVDFRDLRYRPVLRSLPERFPSEEFIERYLKDYRDCRLVLDQGAEGACTGFGLAALVNYLRWKKRIEIETTVALPDTDFLLRPDAVWRRVLDPTQPLASVSSRMLYQMARLYDEWPGEDYEGSSCRGAMKGWHRHGVCSAEVWPYLNAAGKEEFIKPKEGWQQDAARLPLGAYYRINKDAVSDMQAAICEVGAIYCSAEVHAGWFLSEVKKLPTIKVPRRNGETGGHAFAIVGYLPGGFLVQNSWGPKWGFYGFALLTYDDWIQRGADAWVAVMGAPLSIQTTSRARSSQSLTDVVTGKATWFWRSDSVAKDFDYKNTAVEPLAEGDAYNLTVVLGNNAVPINPYLDVETGAQAVRDAAFEQPLRWLSRQKRPRLVVYAHGGLNDEKTSIQRVRVMAPFFLANEIYPLFVTWKTGFLESIEGILEDAVAKMFSGTGERRDRGLITDIVDQLAEAKDRSIEVACENLLVKPVWTQMKQNAAAGRQPNHGIDLISQNLAALRTQLPKLELHVVGHSAGSILLGHLLDAFAATQLTVSTATLLAPACTVQFALDHYLPAFKSKVLPIKNLHIDLLSDERERADSVGTYGKSLLYLVSRALEEVHKMPLLGMEAVWHDVRGLDDLWHEGTVNDVRRWRREAAKSISLRVHDRKRARVSDGQGTIPLAHGSFDNDVDVVSRTLERIRGGKLLAKVESLRGF